MSALGLEHWDVTGRNSTHIVGHSSVELVRVGADDADDGGLLGATAIRINASPLALKGTGRGRVPSLGTVLERDSLGVLAEVVETDVASHAGPEDA